MLNGTGKAHVDHTVHNASAQLTAMSKRLAQDNGRKRHLLCDINGLPIAVGVTSAQPHDSRGGWTKLQRSGYRQRPDA